MTSDNSNGNTARETVDGIVTRYDEAREELIPILKDIDREVGYLSPEALDEVSQLLRVPKGQLFSTASFYKMLSVKPHGRHVIRFCESAPCHVAGGREIWLALQDELELKEGETSPDGCWTLETVSCLGVCGVGPVMLVDEDIYGNITPGQIPEILARYQ
jgi:NADH-quinone oxidoreductase subunit E